MRPRPSVTVTWSPDCRRRTRSAWRASSGGRPITDSAHICGGAQNQGDLMKSSLTECLLDSIEEAFCSRCDLLVAQCRQPLEQFRLFGIELAGCLDLQQNDQIST